MGVFCPKFYYLSTIYKMDLDLCKYSDYLGSPNKGVHQYRMFGVAIVDVIMTIFGGYILAKLFSVRPIVSISFLFLLGIALHRLFCVRTAVDAMLFS